MRISYFISGLLIGTACLLIWRPKETQPQKAAEEQPGRSSRIDLERPSVGKLLSDCREAKSQRHKYQARQALGSLSSGQLQEALEMVAQDGDQYRWTPEARSLIVHWAKRDPQSALAWSWQNLRNSRRWEIAAKEIFETWIASGDPAVIPFLKGTKIIEYALKTE